MKIFKKALLVILILLILFSLAGLLAFWINPSFIQDMFYSLSLPTEYVNVSNSNNVTAKYNYSMYNNQVPIVPLDVTFSKSESEEILELLSNNKYKNYSSEIGLAIFGSYEINLENGIKILFDDVPSNDDFYVLLCMDNKKFLTTIPSRIGEIVTKRIDQELKKVSQKYVTSSITIEYNNFSIENNSITTTISDSYGLTKMLGFCKNFVTCEKSFLGYDDIPDFFIDFNNGRKLYLNSSNGIGRLVENDNSFFVSVPYNLTSFLSLVIANAPKNLSSTFATDLIKVNYQNKDYTITDSTQITQIVERLQYINFMELKPGSVAPESRDIVLTINNIKIVIYGSYYTDGHALVCFVNQHIVYPDGSVYSVTLPSDLEVLVKNFCNI